MHSLNPVTRKALAALTLDWKDLGALKSETGLQCVAFDDLRVFGLAEERREPITRNGVACGERIAFRLSTK